MSNEALENIKWSMGYVRRMYGQVSPERSAEIAREKAEREAMAASMRPRLDAAIDAYYDLAEGDDLIGHVAHLHKPHHYRPFSTMAHCEGCDIGGVDSEEIRWPCTTARMIAEAHGLNLDGMDAYEWR